MRYFLFFSIIISLGYSLPGSHETFSPAEVFSNLVNDASKYITNAAGAEEQNNNREVIKLLDPYFDFDALFSRALRDHWKTVSAADQKRFIGRMTDLVRAMAYPLIKTFYACIRYHISSVSDQNEETAVKIYNYDPARDLEFNTAYIMRRQNSLWQVVDFEVDDSSLADSYRLQFNRLINKEGFPGLMKMLDDKYESLKKPD
ncbi:MAG: hypothetical protein A2096_03460 [Spirochaetes bacterium GWF1_41_5]|nr:MAG: hypothetical protein A2096_03460 [Spirochaetes bacterium GWF1_41_5]